MRLLSLFRGRTWWAILAATAAAALIGAALSIVLPATYRAEATLLVTGPGASRELQLTYVDLLTSDGFLEDLAGTVDSTPAELSEGLEAIPAPGTTLIGIVVEEDSEERAIAEANAVAEGFGPYLEESGLGAAESVAIVRLATSASRSPDLATNTATAAVAGFLAAFGAVVFLAGRPGDPERQPGSGQSPTVDDNEYRDSSPTM